MTLRLVVVHHNAKFGYKRLQTNTQPSGNKYVSRALHPSPLKTPQCFSLIDDHLYSAILRSLEQTHCARMWFYMSDWLFIARFFFFFLYPPKWCTYSAGMAGATWNCSRLGASSVYTIQPRSMSLHANHIRKVYACLAVTCHLHFWQNDRDRLRATAVSLF